MAFSYNQDRVASMLMLHDLLNAMNNPGIKDSIERFGTLYNESRYGPGCSFTKQAYILLDKDIRLNQILSIINEIAEND